MRKGLLRLLAGFLSVAMLLGGIKLSEISAEAASKNLFQNPVFREGNVDVWSAAKGGAVITEEVSEEPIYSTVTTYGKITGRTSNYECFAQDITALVENNKLYDYTFYVMLDAEDYAGASEEMRTVEISPYITVNGTTTYSQGVSGMVRKAIEPGVWTKFTGTYQPSWGGEAEEVVIRILEQGMDYGQGDGVKGTYYVTGLKLIENIAKPLKIDEDEINFCDALCEEMGEDFIAGTSICNSDLLDRNTMALVTKHFNGVTLGNELKPDAMFGYSNNKVPGTETVMLNGKELVVPKLDYSRAHKTLNDIYDWNQENPDKFIKIRGHVLLWHSQTPEWWFHEDYDASKPYADAETMNRRLEWYIKTMAEHFTGKDSKYHGMFYGWDIVNEAVSDGGPRYRNESENSDWWAVYGSNEFIINAFRYANKYMDPEVDLYYNDYGDSSPQKSQGIAKLLKDVKEAEGTRIDGMGMQGHYGTAGSPTVEEFKAAARLYAQIVDQVQLTELDMGATSFYDGTEKTRAAEFATQGYRYKELYDAVKTLRDEGVNFTGITFWGVIDKNSWLQSSSNVGGGSDGKRKQCPLLFDDDYQVKPAFWAFVDPTKLAPVAKQIMMPEIGPSNSMTAAEEMSYSAGTADVKYRAVWSKNFLAARISVTDKEAQEGDYFVVYASADGKNIVSKTVKRSEAMEVVLQGYEATVKLSLGDVELQTGDEVYFDIVVYNDGEAGAFSDKTLSQETTTEYYAKATLVDNPENPKKEPVKEEEPKEETDASADAENTDNQGDDTEASDAEGTAEDVENADSDEVEEKNNLWLYIVIGVVIACAAVGVVILLNVKKKKK